MNILSSFKIITSVKKWRGTSPPWMDLGQMTSPIKIIDFNKFSIRHNGNKNNRKIKQFETVV